LGRRITLTPFQKKVLDVLRENQPLTAIEIAGIIYKNKKPVRELASKIWRRPEDVGFRQAHVLNALYELIKKGLVKRAGVDRMRLLYSHGGDYYRYELIEEE